MTYATGEITPDPLTYYVGPGDQTCASAATPAAAVGFLTHCATARTPRGNIFGLSSIFLIDQNVYKGQLLLLWQRKILKIKKKKKEQQQKVKPIP